ncbi:hypothetical protein ABZ079_35570 [Streptomyces sp. NPDC006314]|uniref:hypothetical protein n=1 Tax=Streptomyces sp. NPDC006314 TaxID=3154475 RepID=UPI0033B675A1
MTKKPARFLSLTAAISALSFGAALLGTGTANASASYIKYIDTYPTYSTCVDVGQSYQREGFRDYDCLVETGGWQLWLRY